MPKPVSVAAKNRYCQARMKAAEWNEKYCSRAGAAEQMPGVTEESLKKYELDLIRPPNDVVAIMADAYNCPELRNWYCAHECSLGKYTREIDEAAPEKTAIRLYNSIGTLRDTTEMLFVLLDGCMGSPDSDQIEQAKTKIIEARKRLDEGLALCEKIERRNADERG